MLIRSEFQSTQKKSAVAPRVKASTAKAPFEAPLDRLNAPRSVPLPEAVFSDLSACTSASAKRRATLMAEFARIGRELHFVSKGDREHFEVRHHTGNYACSTEADLHGLLSRIGASA